MGKSSTHERQYLWSVQAMISRAFRHNLTVEHRAKHQGAVFRAAYKLPFVLIFSMKWGIVNAAITEKHFETLISKAVQRVHVKS